jgi:nitrate reductase beta subunit
MVWYVPPLSPVLATLEGDGAGSDPDDVFPAIDALRIPIAYLANLLTAGAEEPVRFALKRLAALRAAMREAQLNGEEALLDPEVRHLYRLLAIARFDERYVIPQGHAEAVGPLDARQGAAGLDPPLGPIASSSRLVPLARFGRTE